MFVFEPRYNKGHDIRDLNHVYNKGHDIRDLNRPRELSPFMRVNAVDINSTRVTASKLNVLSGTGTLHYRLTRRNRGVGLS